MGGREPFRGVTRGEHLALAGLLAWNGHAGRATLTWAFTTGLPTRNERLASDTTLLVGGVLGTSIQIWGAFCAPPREAPPGTHALHVAPGCTPTPGGALCGVAVAGF